MIGWPLQRPKILPDNDEGGNIARKAFTRAALSRAVRQHEEDPAKSSACIHVAVRVRPLNARELQQDALPAWAVDDNGHVHLTRGGNAPAYAFDTVHGDSSSNQEVYTSLARPVVQAAISGINGTIFAYGVTSSGKTHTMLGGQGQPGLVQQALLELFQAIAQSPDRCYVLRFSMMEIYNEVINDLLEPSNTSLRLREGVSAGTAFAEGLSAVEVRFCSASLARCTLSTHCKVQMIRMQVGCSLRRAWPPAEHCDAPQCKPQHSMCKQPLSASCAAATQLAQRRGAGHVGR